MKAEKTISTHVSGDARARRHNKRDREVTINEPHIDQFGYHETLIDESTVHAYHRLFDPAVEEYNARQTRADRKIKNYHAKVEADPRKHTCYEMTVCVGSKGNPVDRDLGYTIMREYVDGWKDRNPNLELIGAYYHADEEGVPGWHLDFIPVAHGFKNGPSVQTALSRALVEQGFGYIKGRSEDGLRQTPQIQWERSENDMLEVICNKYGVKVVHPERGKNAKHLATPEYKELQDKVHKLESQVEQLNGELVDARSEKLTLDQGINQIEQEVNAIAESSMRPDAFEEYSKLPLKDKIVILDRHISHDKREEEQLNEELPELRAEKKQLKEEDIPGLESQKKMLKEENDEFKKQNSYLEQTVIPQNQQRAEKIISDANTEAQKIKSNANNQAEKIMSDANDQAKTIKSKAETETKQLEEKLPELRGRVQGLEQREKSLDTERQGKLSKAEEQANQIVSQAYQVKYHTMHYPSENAVNYAINTGEVNKSDVYIIYPGYSEKYPLPTFNNPNSMISKDVENGKAVICATVPDDEIVVPKTVCKKIVGCLDRMSSLPDSVKAFTEEFKKSDPDRSRDNSWSEPDGHGAR